MGEGAALAAGEGIYPGLIQRYQQFYFYPFVSVNNRCAFQPQK